MDNVLTRKSWSPYVVGAAIGILSWFAFASADRPIGITSAFEDTAAIVERATVPALADAFYDEQAQQGETPKIGWEWMLVLGVFFGALLSAALSKDRTSMKVPPLWQGRFGDSTAKRFTAAFIGGLIMIVGARLALGCTSGHGISGTLQLAVSSWLFVIVMFAAAVATAFALYGKEGARHV